MGNNNNKVNKEEEMKTEFLKKHRYPLIIICALCVFGLIYGSCLVGNISLIGLILNIAALVYLIGFAFIGVVAVKYKEPKEYIAEFDTDLANIIEGSENKMKNIIATVKKDT